MSPTAYRFVTYLMKYGFTFTFASPMCIWRIVCDSISRPGDLDHWPFDLYKGSRVTRDMCFHRANLNFPRLFHSRVRSRHV